MKKYFKENRFPLIMDYDNTSSKRITEDKEPTLILFYYAQRE